MDGSLAQAPVREKNSVQEGLGANPTDRGRSGGKIHVHADAQGNPLGAVAVVADISFPTSANDMPDVFLICVSPGHGFRTARSGGRDFFCCQGMIYAVKEFYL